MTASPEPATTRPSIFSPTERAKYDAWKAAGATWRGKEPEAEQRYIELAHSLGWTPGTAVTSTQTTKEPTVEELLADNSTDGNTGQVGSGLGQSVSVMQRAEVDEEETLHNLAIKGDAQELESFIESQADIDLNDLDEYVGTIRCSRQTLH